MPMMTSPQEGKVEVRPAGESIPSEDSVRSPEVNSKQGETGEQNLGSSLDRRMSALTLWEQRRDTRLV